MTPMLSYLVCATPRSGSTLLCHALDQTGVAGHPQEYFEALSRSGLPRRPHEYFDPERHANIVERLAFREMPDGMAKPNPLWHPDTYDQYLAWALERGDDRQRRLRRQADVGLPRRLRRAAARDRRDGRRGRCRSCSRVRFPGLRYIQITRENKIRQAVSLWKAVQTQAWKRETGEDASARSEPVFSFRAINYLVRLLTAHDASWDAYFLGLGLRAAEDHLRGARREHRRRRPSACSRTSGFPCPRAWRAQRRACRFRPTRSPEEWVRRVDEHLRALEAPEARLRRGAMRQTLCGRGLAAAFDRLGEARQADLERSRDAPDGRPRRVRVAALDACERRHGQARRGVPGPPACRRARRACAAPLPRARDLPGWVPTQSETSHFASSKIQTANCWYLAAVTPSPQTALAKAGTARPRAPVPAAWGSHRGTRQAVLARLRAALEQPELDERRRVAVGRARAHAEVACDLDDATRAPSGPKQVRIERPRSSERDRRGSLVVDRQKPPISAATCHRRRCSRLRHVRPRRSGLGTRVIEMEIRWSLVMGAMFADADDCLQPVFLSVGAGAAARSRSSSGSSCLHVQSLRMSTASRSPTSPTPAARSPTRPAPRWPCCAGATATSSTGAWSRSGSPRTRSATSTPATRPRARRSASRALPRFGMPLLMEPRARVTRHLARLPGDRRHAPARPRARGRGAARAAARLVHDHAAARRGRRHRAGARARRTARRRRDRRGDRRRGTLAAYEDDKRQTRSAEGGPTDFQGKARQTDGPVRYSAPSLVFDSEDGRAWRPAAFRRSRPTTC